MGLRRDRGRVRGSRLHRLSGGHDEVVFARDAAAGACSGDRVEIDVMLFGETTHGRGGATAPRAIGVIFDGWRRYIWRRRRWGRWWGSSNWERLRGGRRLGSGGRRSRGGVGGGGRCAVAAADEPKH